MEESRMFYRFSGRYWGNLEPPPPPPNWIRRWVRATDKQRAAPAFAPLLGDERQGEACRESLDLTVDWVGDGEFWPYGYMECNHTML